MCQPGHFPGDYHSSPATLSFVSGFETNARELTAADKGHGGHTTHGPAQVRMLMIYSRLQLGHANPEYTG